MKFKGLSACLLIILISSFHLSAAYIDGTDTTDVNGNGLNKSFVITPGSYQTFKAGTNGLRCWGYGLENGENGYFHYSYNDLLMAPSGNGSSYSGAAMSSCFVIEARDSTFTKIQTLKQISGNRYLFKYRKNLVPNSRSFADSSYARTVLYKPNNAFNVFFYPLTYAAPDTLRWDPPIPNNNHLIGYIIYESKQGVTIDTSKIINIAQWDSLYFTTATMAPHDPKSGNGPSVILNFNFREFGYLNIVAVYSEGRSAFLQGWTYYAPTSDGIEINSSLSCQQSVPLSITKTSTGMVFSITPAGRGNVTLFNLLGDVVARLSGTQNGSFFWNTHGQPQGTYIIRAELADHNTVCRPFTVMR